MLSYELHLGDRVKVDCLDGSLFQGREGIIVGVMPTKKLFAVLIDDIPDSLEFHFDELEKIAAMIKPVPDRLVPIKPDETLEWEKRRALRAEHLKVWAQERATAIEAVKEHRAQVVREALAQMTKTIV